MKIGSFLIGSLVCSVALFATTGRANAQVHTNPLNNDPMVKQAYERFYLLDYPAAVDLFERFHAAHPGDPQASAMLLEALVFQELYRQDLLDTTFYANDGFLTGKHATQEDPKIRDRILSAQRRGHPRGRLAAQPESQ